MPRRVGDRDAEDAVGHRDEVEVVAADELRRRGEPRGLELAAAQRALRQDGHLNVGRHFEFALETFLFDQLFLRSLPDEMGPGNAVTITVEFGNVAEVFTGFGERGVRAEAVAARAADEAREYLASSGVVGEG